MGGEAEHVLVTGANRGLGYEFARQYAEAGACVLATCREPDRADALAALARAHAGRVEVVALDVTHHEASAGVAAAVERVFDGRLDILVNNAGLSPRGERLGNIDADDMLAVLHVNTVAPLLLIQALRPALERSSRPRVANISSSMGSLGERDYGRHYSYGASKAGLNMVTRAAAHDLADTGVCVVSLHPGWVRTDLGGAHAHLAPEESVAGMRGVIDRLSRADSGRFLTWTGDPHPW